MTFLDTSIFVAATQRGHIRHEASLAILAGIAPGSGFCAAHSIAELYSVLTRSPRPQRLTPRDALAVVELLRKRIKIVHLNTEEHVEVIQELAAKGLSGGIVHDALILRCAKKSKARKIYTLNAGHFRVVDPEMAEFVLEP